MTLDWQIWHRWLPWQTTSSTWAHTSLHQAHQWGFFYSFRTFLTLQWGNKRSRKGQPQPSPAPLFACSLRAWEHSPVRCGGPGHSSKAGLQMHAAWWWKSVDEVEVVWVNLWAAADANKHRATQWGSSGEDFHITSRRWRLSGFNPWLRSSACSKPSLTGKGSYYLLKLFAEGSQGTIKRILCEKV